MLRSTCLLLAATCVMADVYLHVPRGSNNRLNENSANRQNANRLFDSQNNNRGGYNVGDQGQNAQAGNGEENQYRMTYFQSAKAYKTLTDDAGKSFLTFEWTNQHGCGGNEDTDPHKQNCNIVFQYMCMPEINSATGAQGAGQIRNGETTATQNYQQTNNQNENQNAATNRRNNNVNVNRGLQEPWEWYDKCNSRERNAGLFTADQKLKANNGRGISAAIYTRQNPNGNRRGYECPEERDYYPYWHPTVWRDIAVLSENASQCAYYTNNSFNTRPYGECIETYGNGQAKHWSQYNNPADCADNGGEWTEFSSYLDKAPEFTTQAACEAAGTKDGHQLIWAIPYDRPLIGSISTDEACLVAMDPPECKEAPWSRSNHLGNGRDGVANNYTWTIPQFTSTDTQRCAMRIRYNISTDDYDPFNTDSTQNKNIAQGIVSPVQQNPIVEVGASSPLRLAINTAQFGRVFQDRSHAFLLAPRPAGVGDEKLYNLNVRGKRGNIVQTFPAVEYDFAPNDLNITDADLVHIQWTGSNSHNNGNPGGDGQTGDAGEGTGGTDRSNIVEILDRNDNFPIPFENTNMWTGAEIKWVPNAGKTVTAEDLAVNMASSGYYQCMNAATCQGESVQNKAQLNNLLNNAPASYEGAVVKFKEGLHQYMSTRNNNFSNRSQKGGINVNKK
ncbi:unnamed protein product [Owenia fusiformis]|uniref:Uncharacterized protein n=1 Tax=Owenia fusiformis TaxID=6347 RepID=A0A8J1T708_OWEFU|nr:unnamed protein product [Owenia fusiformis]